MALGAAGRNLLLLLALLFGNFVLMSSSVRNAQGMSLLERGVVEVSDPVLGVAREVGGGVRDVTDGFGDMRSALDENRRLRSELARLREEVSRHREQVLENERLRGLLELRATVAPRSVAASVVTARLDHASRVLVLDQGRAGGIDVDDAVVAWGGAVGRVVYADREHAKVRLLTDPNSGVAGLVQRTRVDGILVGQGDGTLRMAYVPSYADVAVGDRVITSGLDGVFPKGFGIGRIVEVEGEPGATKLIRVRPDVDAARLEEVLVLTEPLGGGLLEQPEAAAAPPGQP